MNRVTISDTFGDKLTLSESSGYFYVETDGEVSEYQLGHDEAHVLRDVCNEYLQPEFDWSSETPPNEAKLRLAAEFNLKAKFAYKGERDYRAVERRVEVEDVHVNGDHVLVGGESYDEGGQSEGYRQFRLDRISGSVVIR